MSRSILSCGFALMTAASAVLAGTTLARADSPSDFPAPINSLTSSPINGPMQPRADAGMGDRNSGAVYDIAPAAGRAAFYQAEFDRTSSEYAMLISRQRDRYLNSPEFTAAVKHLAEARAGYEAARLHVIAQLLSNADYQTALAKRTKLEMLLKQPMAAADRAALAQQKLIYANQASALEADALASDAQARQAQSDYISAQEDLSSRTVQAEARIADDPAILAARQALDQSISNRAAAEAYLAAAMVTRQDSIASDIRHSGFNASTGYNTVAPYYAGDYGYTNYSGLVSNWPLWSGYYQIGVQYNDNPRHNHHP